MLMVKMCMAVMFQYWSMTGNADGDPPAFQQATAGRDAYVIRRHLNVYLKPPVDSCSQAWLAEGTERVAPRPCRKRADGVSGRLSPTRKAWGR